MVKRTPSPVSRVDSGRTYGFFARVYRAEWVGPKSFADRQYGGRDAAEAAAWKWVEMADKRLPIIPPKPVLFKSTVHLREESKDSRLKYYNVYLPPKPGDTVWTEKFYFHAPPDKKIYRNKVGIEVIDLTTNEALTAREKAYALRDATNARLQAEYREALVSWYLKHDQLMEEILRLWDEIKGEEN